MSFIIQTTFLVFIFFMSITHYQLNVILIILLFNYPFILVIKVIGGFVITTEIFLDLNVEDVVAIVKYSVNIKD